MLDIEKVKLKLATLEKACWRILKIRKSQGEKRDSKSLQLYKRLSKEHYDLSQILQREFK